MNTMRYALRSGLRASWLVGLLLCGAFWIMSSSPSIHASVTDEGIELHGLVGLRRTLTLTLGLPVTASAINPAHPGLSLTPYLGTGGRLLGWPTLRPTRTSLLEVGNQKLVIDPDVEQPSAPADWVNLQPGDPNTFGQGGSHASQVEPLLPTASDGLEHWRNDWLGTGAYAVGGLTGGCITGAPALVDDNFIAPNQPFRLTLMRRLARPQLLNTQAGLPGYNGADALSLTPIVVVIELMNRHKPLWQAGCGFRRAIIMPSVLSIERIFSHETEEQMMKQLTRSPDRERWKVAWKRNFPDGEYGSVQQLLKLHSWRYRQGQTVHQFDQRTQ